MNAPDSTCPLVAVMDTIDAISSNHPVHNPQDLAVRLRQVYAAQDLPLEEDTLKKALAAHVVQAHRAAVPSQKHPRTVEKKLSTGQAIGCLVVAIALQVIMALSINTVHKDLTSIHFSPPTSASP